MPRLYRPTIQPPPVGQTHGCPKYHQYPTVEVKKEMPMCQAFAIQNDKKAGEIDEFRWGADHRWPTTPDDEPEGIRWVVTPTSDTDTKKRTRNLLQWEKKAIARKLFTRDMVNLMHEWQDLVQWLSYRQMVSYWLGLGRFRSHVYTDEAYMATVHRNMPRSVCHDAKHRLQVKLFTVRHTPSDEDYYFLMCKSFCYLQRRFREKFLQRVEMLENMARPFLDDMARYMAINEARQMVGGYVKRAKMFEVVEEFDLNMNVDADVLERHGRYAPTADGSGPMVPAPWRNEPMDFDGTMYCYSKMVVPRETFRSTCRRIAAEYGATPPRGLRGARYLYYP
ncbi:hypothetical protein B0T10DRAFT_563593 [Thelonectria olida]|uniref:Uncharacterized protein n=1 Tax=Thelonectria olida TaxID=1576542 RepID=A0A9P8W0Z7_9HYPO|nr:hypothetical protein B0T10DRAFT_563593 [Thelonectria olida]